MYNFEHLYVSGILGYILFVDIFTNHVDNLMIFNNISILNINFLNYLL